MNGVGFYGKLPGAGDFVKRRLPRDFVDAWDLHFQRAVENGRRELGQQWTNAWREGAAWRFALPPQVCGTSAWCGVTTPALDRLGREFPMVLASPCVGDLTRVLDNAAWFDALEHTYRSAHDEAVSVETFDAHVASLPHIQADAYALAARWKALPWDSGQWQLDLPRELAAGAALREAWRELGTRAEPWCLWWTENAAQLLATRGLPRSYAALLTGRRVKASEGEEDVRHATTSPQDDTIRRSRPEVSATASALVASEGAPAIDEPGSAWLCLDQRRTLVLSADDGPYDSRRVAARSIRETVSASAHDIAAVRAALMSLHERLRDSKYGAPDSSVPADIAAYVATEKTADMIAAETAAAEAVNENGAAVIVRLDGLHARLLRIGPATLWHWRRGKLQATFVERAAGEGGEFDDLLFGDAWLDMPGLGTLGEPACDEAALLLEPGDRLLLLATRALTQLPRELLAQALALPTCGDARAHLAHLANLHMAHEPWPLAVVEVRA
ncbi:type VI secretion-associated protein (plasmid) [Paraburkholderia aromaticivorans]|uniref:Type VI secretion-associated protein n=2 Tax=Paraburkholderia aromaticivorans TaxID=2026199 RepID=A0A248VYL9_9BURK|nr:type VI secretion-associated protein [Paraburkholderia aromaticivorans]